MQSLVPKLRELFRIAEELENHLVDHGDTIYDLIPDEIAARGPDGSKNSYLTLLNIQYWAYVAADRLEKLSDKGDE